MRDVECPSTGGEFQQPDLPVFGSKGGGRRLGIVARTVAIGGDDRPSRDAERLSADVHRIGLTIERVEGVQIIALAGRNVDGHDLALPVVGDHQEVPAVRAKSEIGVFRTIEKLARLREVCAVGDGSPLPGQPGRHHVCAARCR